MYRNTGLVRSTAAAFLLLAAPARAQAVPPSTLSGQPAAGIPPAEAYSRALGALDAGQRTRAAMLLDDTGGAA